MKLSECLGWPEKKEGLIIGVEATWHSIGFNEILTVCDREIDREALAEILFKDHSNGDWKNFNYKEGYLEEADYLISTMPTWLKRIEK